MLRIACLVPSITELLVAMGLGPALVARTGFCVHPADVLSAVPKVGGTKDVNLRKLRQLAPTHVIVNIDENRVEMVDALRSWPLAERPEIIVTHPRGPGDVPALIDQLARHLVPDASDAEPIGALRATVCRELALTDPRGRDEQAVLYLIWRDPWMTVARDTYISRMLARINWQTWPDIAGGERGAARYPALTGDEPWLPDVQRVLLSSEPYRFDASHVAAATSLCPRAKVMLVDGEALSWYGSRTIGGLRYLRRLAAD